MAQSNADVSSGRALPVLLALIAGYLDGYGLRFLGAFVSFMSGNTTIAGMYIGEESLRAALPSVVAITFFVIGSVFGNFAVHSRLRQSRRMLFGLIALLLAGAAVLEKIGGANALFEISLISVAMGMINPAICRVGSEPVSVTFVTGTLNRMGAHVAAALGPLSGSTASRSSQLIRAGIDALMWFGFLIGAVLSGVLASSAKAWALWPPCLAITAVATLGRLQSAPNGSHAGLQNRQ